MIPWIEGHLVDAGGGHGAGVDRSATELRRARQCEVEPLEQAGTVPRPQLLGAAEVRDDHPVRPRDVVVDGGGIDRLGLDADEATHSSHETIRLRGEDVHRRVGSIGEVHQLRGPVEIRDVVAGEGSALDIPRRVGRDRDGGEQDVDRRRVTRGGAEPRHEEEQDQEQRPSRFAGHRWVSLILMRTVRTLGCLVTPGEDSVNLSVIAILRGVRSRKRGMSSTNIPSGMCNWRPVLGSAALETRLANQDVPTQVLSRMTR